MFSDDDELEADMNENEKREPDPSTGLKETFFHEQVRDILGLSPWERHEKIFDELKRLKRIEAATSDKFCQPDDGIVIERA